MCPTKPKFRVADLFLHFKSHLSCALLYSVLYNQSGSHQYIKGNIVIIVSSSLFQKTATAVAHCKRGTGVVRVNGRPLDQVEPRMLRTKVHFLITCISKSILSL